MIRQASEKRGRGAETIAALWLRLHGWRILARRARVRGGEVDIIARRGRTLAFVEVKARATADAAAFSLDAYRLRRRSSSPPSGSPRATCATATSSELTRCSSFPAAGRDICRTSGKGDKAGPLA